MRALGAILLGLVGAVAGIFIGAIVGLLVYSAFGSDGSGRNLGADAITTPFTGAIAFGVWGAFALPARLWAPKDDDEAQARFERAYGKGVLIGAGGALAFTFMAGLSYR